jgi:hypothetical protein
MGIEVDSEAHKEAMLRVVEACRKTGKIPGTACAGIEQGAHRIKQGYLFVTPVSDLGPVIADAQNVLKELKDLPG